MGIGGFKDWGIWVWGYSGEGGLGGREGGGLEDWDIRGLEDWRIWGMVDWGNWWKGGLGD